MRRISIILIATALAFQARAQVQTAGNLLVSIDASGLPLGPVASVPNAGTSGGTFDATGLIDIDQPVVINVGGGSKGIMFDGRNFMEHVSEPGIIKPAPAEIVGGSPRCSVEVWVNNPTLLDFDAETMVSWGSRDGQLMAFGYGTEGNHGAVDHWGANLGWGSIPAAGAWHHLVYTYDGTTTRIYADGVERGSLAGGFTTSASNPITLAAQRLTTGALTGQGGNRGSLAIGRLRIHSGTLTGAQVSNNYDIEKASFVTTPAPLTARPTHRYSFNNAAAASATDATVQDTGTAAGEAAVIKGEAAFTGTKVRMPGGSSETAGYVDLPNGLVSSLAATASGSGEITLEGWVEVTGRRFWIRFFDFGNTTEGEHTGPGGGGNGADYFMLAQPNDWRDWAHLEIQNMGFGGGPGSPDGGSSSTREFGLENGNGVYGLKHFAVTWKESTGEIVVYENGIASTRFITDRKLDQINDVNAWLGRSNWTADNNLQGDYDEFRIYDRVLSPAEVMNNFVAGADAVAVEPGTLQTLELQFPRLSFVAGTFAQATLIGDFQNVENVNVTTRSGVSFQSDNTGVLTISSSGAITAVSPGTAKITASLSGVTTEQTVTVTPIVATLTHRYSFNEAEGSATVTDSVGGETGAGTLQGSATLNGTQVVLDGNFSYVDLPSNLLGTPAAVTVEAWASFGVNPNWVRLFDFGDQNDVMNAARTTFFLSPHTGGGTTQVTINTPAGDRSAVTGGTLDGQNNVHLVAVLNTDGKFLGLYINGVLAASNNDAAVPISTLGNVYSWIGRSLYSSDGYLVGSVDEFRVYDGTLTPQRIAINRATGPNQIVTDPGALQSITATAPAELISATTAQTQLTGTFANVAGVNLFAYGAPIVTSDNTGVVQAEANGVIRGVGPGNAVLTYSFGGKTTTANVTVTAPVPALKHRYSFSDTEGSATAADSVGGGEWAGTLQGTASIVDGALVLDGLGSYLDIPANLISGYYALTVEAWASFGVNPNWVRVWDFGSQNTGGGGETGIFFSPHSGFDGTELTMFAPGRNDHVSTAPVLDNMNDVHIVGVYFPAAGYQQLYLNGVLAGENRGATLQISAINDALNFIGKSLYNADPTLVGTIDEVRIYEGALDATKVAANFAAGPDQLSVDAPSLVVSQTGNTLRISWPASATQYVLQSSATVTGPWGAAGLTETTQNGQRVATETIPATAGTKFYRLIQAPQ